MFDAHHHLWDTTVRDYAWMDGPWADPLRGTFDLARYARTAPVTGSIVVQALHSAEETRELLTAGPPVAGVVGWTDLAAPGVAAAVRSPGLVGIRHQVQDEPDPSWLLRDDVRRGLRAVGEAGLVFDLLVKPPQADAALATARALPEVPFVLDHAGKPGVAQGVWEPWASWITAMASLPNVTVKLSGLVTEAAPDRLDAVLPYALHVLDVFGPHRTMYGSDWPVCTLAASFAEVTDLAGTAASGLTGPERAEFFGGTARRVYRVTG